MPRNFIPAAPLGGLTAGAGGSNVNRTNPERTRSRKATIMKPWLSILCCILVAMTATGVRAADDLARAIEGSYLLIQDDEYQRVLSFDRGGTVSQVSEQQPLLGFTSGQGAWEQTGPDTVVARVIDFNFGLDDGKPTGASLIVYTLTFSEPLSGNYQQITGTYAGKNFAVGQNPLNPAEPPAREFGIGFTGQRITAK